MQVSEGGSDVGKDQDLLDFGIRLQAVTGGALRDDVVWQVFNSLAHQPVELAAFVPVGPRPAHGVTGTLLLFTASAVAFVELTDAPWARSVLPAQWTATVDLRRRSALAAVQVRGAELLGARDNRLAPHRLSATSTVELTYAGRDPITVDRDAVHGTLDQLLAAVLADLAGSTPRVDAGSARL